METNRLRIVTNCIVDNGELVYPKQTASIDILKLPRPLPLPENSGFGLYLKDNGECIGHISILFKRKPYELSVGVDEPYQKQGYMTEAQDAVVQWLFEKCNVDRIWALVGPITPSASRKILSRGGFKMLQEKNEEWWCLEKDQWVAWKERNGK